MATPGISPLALEIASEITMAAQENPGIDNIMDHDDALRQKLEEILEAHQAENTNSGWDFDNNNLDTDMADISGTEDAESPLTEWEDHFLPEMLVELEGILTRDFEATQPKQEQAPDLDMSQKSDMSMNTPSLG